MKEERRKGMKNLFVPEEKIIFAIDVEDYAEAVRQVELVFGKPGNGSQTKGKVKLGIIMGTHAFLTGQSVYLYIKKYYPGLRVMVDFKTGDIPDTMEGMAKQITMFGESNIFGFTVHCTAGPKALANTVKAIKTVYGNDPNAPLVIGVTLLTSLDQNDMDQIGFRGTPSEEVLRLAMMASNEGVPAIVCSAHETADVLKIDKQFVVINPGIRFAGSDVKSQKRVTTPEIAFVNGAAYIVMGSDLRKGDPAANMKRAAEEVALGWKKRQEILARLTEKR